MYCMHCGEEIPDSSRFCKYCGKKVEETAEVWENGPEAADIRPAGYAAAAVEAAALPVKEEYDIVDGFFFKDVSLLNKFLLLILGAVIMLLTASLVFMCSYPDLVTEVFNTIR